MVTGVPPGATVAGSGGRKTISGDTGIPVDGDAGMTDKGLVAVLMLISPFIIMFVWLFYVKYRGRSYSLVQISEQELQLLDSAREGMAVPGRSFVGSPGRTLLRKVMFFDEGLKVTENGITARFGTPMWRNYGVLRVVKGYNIVVATRYRFYRYEDISGIYPIRMGYELYHTDNDPTTFPGVQVETRDLRTAVVPFRVRPERMMARFEDVMRSLPRDLYHPDEVIEGCESIMGGTDGEGTAVMTGDLHRHKFLRDLA